MRSHVVDRLHIPHLTYQTTLYYNGGFTTTKFTGPWKQGELYELGYSQL